MRINVKITSYLNSWYPKFPRINLDECYPTDEHGEANFDEANFRTQIRNQPSVMIGKSDATIAMAFAAILIQSVDDWLDSNDVDDDDERSKKISARINKRLDRGNHSWCRIDINDLIVNHKGSLVRGIKIKITLNDNQAIENHPYEHDFGMIVADFAQCYSRKYEKRGDPPLILDESVQRLLHDLNAITQDSKRNDEIKAANKKRIECERNHRGFCSPCTPDCPNYENGKCIELK